MTFNDVKRLALELAELIKSRTDRDLISAVTLEEPSLPEDELHFMRLVNWGYVYFNEAGAFAFREISRLLKSSDPTQSKIYQDGKRTLEVLRTMSTHNLAPPSAANERTRRQASAWMIANGGSPPSWPKSCLALADELVTMIACLRSGFDRMANSNGGPEIGIPQLLAAVDNSWPPHLFDQIVQDAAERLNLNGLDVVAYRKSRQEQWRELVGLFIGRDEGGSALERIIDAELRRLFGDEPLSIKTSEL